MKRTFKNTLMRDHLNTLGTGTRTKPHVMRWGGYIGGDRRAGGVYVGSGGGS